MPQLVPHYSALGTALVLAKMISATAITKPRKTASAGSYIMAAMTQAVFLLNGMDGSTAHSRACQARLCRPNVIGKNRTLAI